MKSAVDFSHTYAGSKKTRNRASALFPRHLPEIPHHPRRELRQRPADGFRRPPHGLGHGRGAVKPLEAGRLIGESRNTVYRLLAAGKLRAVKRGASTIVLMASIRQHMASLPPAMFGADRADAASHT